MSELGRRLRRTGTIAILALATGLASTAGAEFNSSLTTAQVERIFAQDCQSEEAAMRRQAAASGESYVRNDRIVIDVLLGNETRATLEEGLLEGRREIEGATNPNNRTLYLLMHCVVEAKYNIALDRERSASPAPRPAPAPAPAPSPAYSSPFSPQPAPAAPTVATPLPQNGPLVSQDEEEDEEEEPVAAPPPPSLAQPKLANNNNNNFQGNGPLVTNTPPPQQVDTEGEPIDSQSNRCFAPPTRDEEQVSTGIRYNFVFTNRCKAPIVVFLTYSANPLAADPTTNVTVYNGTPLAWNCIDQKIGRGDCTQGVVDMYARWKK